MSDASYDAARLEAPLAIDEGESSWYCFEGYGDSSRGRRHLGGLVWIHRTGPRASSLGLGPSLVPASALPARWRALVPSWLPIVSPVDFGLDDRPLFMVAIYDLDAPQSSPSCIELTIEHADFDAATFSAVAPGRVLELQRSSERPFAATVRARTGMFDLELFLHETRTQVTFGDAGSPWLRHGEIEVGYAQRRIAVTGSVAFAGERIDHFRGVGAHDRHWRHRTPTGLRWLWIHLRLPGERELVAYVIRDSRGGAFADADDGDELGRNTWLIDASTRVTPIGAFTLAARDHVDTARGRVPTSFVFEAPALDLRVVFEHAVPLPFLTMRAFGELATLGVYEGPIVIRSGACEGGWLEIVPVRLLRDV